MFRWVQLTIKLIQQYNFRRVMSKLAPKEKKKQLRKPISDNFSPKRLAINFQPPTIIMEYLAVDTGKLYHHKMRLDSIFRRANVNRIDVLNYVKNKHHLYFANGKIKDAQLLKFIDKIIAKTSKNKKTTKEVKEEPSANNYRESEYNKDDDFDYLNDDDQYEEDYEDYEEPEDHPPKKPEIKKEVANLAQPNAFNRNTFLTFCKEYEDSNEEEPEAQWDLNMEDSGDFV